MGGKQRKYTSVTTWVSGAMFGVLVAFAGVMMVNLRAHQQTAHALRMLSESYLPLSLMVSEARANAGVYAAMLLRADEPGVRAWLETAAELRAVPLRRAERAIDQALSSQAYASETHIMQRLRTDVARSRALLRQSGALNASRQPDWVQRVTPIEAENGRILRRVWEQIDRRLREIASQAAAQERASLQIVVILSALFLLLGVAATLLIRRLLTPLPLLAKRMKKVERGELQVETLPHRFAHTELTELAEQFENMVQGVAEARAKLVSSERLAAVGKMAAHVAHEVRNPLSSIGLNVELLAEEVALDRAPEARKVLAAIQKEIERLTEITREYLTFTRVPTPKRSREDLTQICRDALDLVRNEMQQAKVVTRMESSLSRSESELLVDENQIRQVLLNLLRNSKDAGASEITLHISRSVEKASVPYECVVLQVVDNGEGIPEAAVGSLFEAFHTTKPQGTGLGLALSRQILEAHGGALTLQRTDASGTCFRMVFPCQSVAVAQPPEME